MAFSGVYVLKDIDFEIYPGEIHALIGENGAGKSTLAKIIGGIYQPKKGEILLEGRPVEFANPQQAIKDKIALIHQEPQVFPDLSIAESVFVNRLPGNRITGLVDWKRISQEASELFSSLNQEFDLKAKVGKLSIADRQMVDIANALSQGAKVLLMDEVTASLTPSEVESLFKIIRNLKAKGSGIVFIGHRLEEVCSVADTVTILRDGEVIAKRIPPDTKMDKIINFMVGREVKNFFIKTKHEPGKALLQVNDLSSKNRFQNISFEVREKEIVCLAGLVGSGSSAECHQLELG
jgi:ABC-type sugar transport system ATPase subunit